MGQQESSLISDDVQPVTLKERSLEAVAEYIHSGKVKRIVVMAGAGISTAAGIPDFRSPKTGLYSNLARLNLPHAEAVFDIDYFRKNPEPFYVLAKELYPGKFQPTISHVFLALLAKKGLLRMLFTQNIDCLERAAGVPEDKIIEAHGSFAKQRCIDCKEEYPADKMREHVQNGQVPRCEDARCGGLVKPDIVFFGEALPADFRNNTFRAAMADLALVIGTSLKVYPFASLPEMVRDSAPRVLFNMERVGRLGAKPDDVLSLGPCDQGIRQLAEKLGWKDELEKMWRDLVGDAEADRQTNHQQGREQEVEDDEDDVQNLTAQVDAFLRLNQQDPSDEDDNNPAAQFTESDATKKLTENLNDSAGEAEVKAAAAATAENNTETNGAHGSAITENSKLNDTTTALPDSSEIQSASQQVKLEAATQQPKTSE